MGIKKANSDIVAVKIGSTDLSAIYHGSDLVWEGTYWGVKGKCDTNIAFNIQLNGQSGYNRLAKIVAGPDENGLYDFELKTQSNETLGWDSFASSINNCVVEITYFKTKGTTFHATFMGNYKTTKVNLSEDSKERKVLNRTSNMFYSSSAHEIIGIGDYNIDEAQNTVAMFHRASNIEELDLHKWNRPGKNNPSYFFRYCNKLRTIGNVQHWDFSSYTASEYFFGDCYVLSGIENMVSQWNLCNYNNLEGFFYNCKGLVGELNLNNWGITNKLKNAQNLFSGCYNLTSIKIGSWDLSSITNANGMFNSCKALLSCEADFSNSTKLTDIEYLFAECENLEGNIDLSNTSISKIAYAFYHTYKVNKFILPIGAKITTIINSFRQLNGKTIPRFENVETLDVSDVTDFRGTFANWANFGGTDSSGNRKVLDLRSWDFGKAIRLDGFMSNMGTWASPRPLVYLPNNLVGNSVTNIGGLFAESWIYELDTTNWDTTNVTTGMNDFLSTWTQVTVNANTSGRGPKCNIILSKGFFNTMATKISIVISDWNDETEIATMLDNLINHDKTNVEKWDSEDDYDEWYGSQTIELGTKGTNVYNTTKEAIDASENLTSLLEQAQEAGWCFNFINIRN